jgi:pyruvate formate lyase activating enzyme
MDGGALIVGGYTPFSATDYPGRLAAVVFVQGCAWRCGYCHNPHLQQRPRHSPLPWALLLERLERRAGLLDAVVFSGGEPTTDTALPGAIADARALGFHIGLHTACIYPDRLKAVLPLVDWVGFDVKAPFAAYSGVTGVAGSGRQAEACVRAILDSGVEYECRTTVHPRLLPPRALQSMAATLSGLGVDNYVLQTFRATGCGDPSLAADALPGYPDAALIASIAPLFKRFSVRTEGSLE